MKPFLLVSLLLSLPALAQVPNMTPPNLNPPPAIATPPAAAAAAVAAPAQATAAPRTVYESPDFSVSFNDSAVSTDSNHNDAGTSVITYYSTSHNDVIEMVAVRKISHDIDVNQTSSAFYLSPDNNSGSQITQRSDGYYQQHPYSYGYVSFAVDGAPTVERERVIVVNSRTVLMLMMISPPDKSDQSEWEAFANSLSIK